MDIEIDLEELVGPREKGLKCNKYWRRTLEIEVQQAMEDAGYGYSAVALVYLPGDAVPAKRAYIDGGNWAGYSRAQYGARDFNGRINWAPLSTKFFRRQYVANARCSRLSQSYMKSRLP